MNKIFRMNEMNLVHHANLENPVYRLVLNL